MQDKGGIGVILFREEWRIAPGENNAYGGSPATNPCRHIQGESTA